MKTSIMKKSLLDYAIKGKLTSKFRRENPHLSAFDEIHAYNAQIAKTRKAKQKELATLEKESKTNKTLKPQIATLKKEIAKLKEIQILNSPSLAEGDKGGGYKNTLNSKNTTFANAHSTHPLAPSAQGGGTMDTHSAREGESFPFEIPNSWAWVKLGDICEIVRGASPRPIEKYLSKSNSGVNWIKIGDSDIGGKYITSTKQKIIPKALPHTKFVKNGSLLLTNSMSFGRPYILKIDGCIHDGWLVLSDFENSLAIDYAFYLLSSNFINSSFAKSAAGGVVKNLTTDKVKEQIIPIPPLNEQQAIAQKLESLIHLADEFEATQENLKRIEKRIEKSLLRYAILGKLSSKFRAQNPHLSAYDEIHAYNAQIRESKKAKQKALTNLEKESKTNKTLKPQIAILKKEIATLKEIEILNPQSNANLCHTERSEVSKNKGVDLQNPLDSSLRGRSAQNDKESAFPFPIPNSWAWVKLGDICEIFTGDSINATTKAKYFTNLASGTNYIGTKDISDRREIAYENGIKIPQNMLDKFKIAHKDSTLLCVEGGSAGRKIGFLEQSVCFGNKLCCFESAFANAKFIYFYLQNPHFVYEFSSNLTGIIGGVSKDKIQNFLIPLPPKPEQESIAKQLDTLFSLSKGLRVE